MFKVIFLVVLLTISQYGYALSDSQLKSLKESIHEMCVTPDQKGSYLKADGNIKAGVPIPIRIVNGQLSGRLQYESWNGINITLDKYKTDPRQCALEMLKLLLPAFTSDISTENKCKAEKDACESELAGIFDACMKKEIRGCVTDCQKRGFQQDQCVAFLCNYSNMSPLSKDFYDNRCHSKDEYINKRSSCSRSYSDCLNAK